MSGEAERIKKCRGRVFALQDEPEVPRVWLPFDDAPGLAMARAFGDFCLKDYGVISVPDFFHWSLTEKDQFVILASDGVIIPHFYLTLLRFLCTLTGCWLIPSSICSCNGLDISVPARSCPFLAVGTELVTL
jgi:hypothetical protein